jgi:hypothetical protein
MIIIVMPVHHMGYLGVTLCEQAVAQQGRVRHWLVTDRLEVGDTLSKMALCDRISYIQVDL